MAFLQRKTPLPMIELTESAFVRALADFSGHKLRYDAMISNSWVTPHHEADMLAIRPSGLIDEFEIKLSRADFLADKKKQITYDKTRNDNFKLVELENGRTLINNFWYVIPKGLVDHSLVPHFAGLIEISNKVEVIKHPTRLHSRKADYRTRYELVRKLSNRFWGAETINQKKPI